MHVMLDSNVLISKIAFPTSFLASVVDCVFIEHNAVLSSFVESETRHKIHSKFPNSVDAMNELFSNPRLQRFILPDDWDELIDVPPIRDPKGEDVLASAIMACCDILITGDKDFNEVSVPGLMIMNPRQFFDWNEEQK